MEQGWHLAASSERIVENSRPTSVALQCQLEVRLKPGMACKRHELVPLRVANENEYSNGWLCIAMVVVTTLFNIASKTTFALKGSIRLALPTYGYVLLHAHMRMYFHINQLPQDLSKQHKQAFMFNNSQKNAAKGLLKAALAMVSQAGEIAKEMEFTR